MVRALLAGTKTQTRRIINPQPPADFVSVTWDASGTLTLCPAALAFSPFHKAVRRIKPGDRLWVRETLFRDPDLWVYAADKAPVGWPARGDLAGKVRDYVPSIHMARVASRLTLNVTGVKVERLRDITLADICAEGLARSIYEFKPVQRGFDAWLELWDGINGPGSWDANPWVAAYTFTVHHQSIDQMEAA